MKPQDFYNEVLNFRALNESNSELIRNQFGGFNKAIVVVSLFFSHLKVSESGEIGSVISSEEIYKTLHDLYDWIKLKDRESRELNYICYRDLTLGLDALIAREVVTYIDGYFHLNIINAAEYFHVLEV